MKLCNILVKRASSMCPHYQYNSYSFCKIYPILPSHHSRIFFHASFKALSKLPDMTGTNTRKNDDAKRPVTLPTPYPSSLHGFIS